MQHVCQDEKRPAGSSRPAPLPFPAVSPVNPRARDTNTLAPGLPSLEPFQTHVV